VLARGGCDGGGSGNWGLGIRRGGLNVRPFLFNIRLQNAHAALDKTQGKRPLEQHLSTCPAFFRGVPRGLAHLRPQFS